MQSSIYDGAFSRNIGWLTRRADRLRHKRVAIAGLSDVGGVHLLTLCRLGIGKFHLADFDAFNMSGHKCSYSNMACHLCNGVTATKS